MKASLEDIKFSDDAAIARFVDGIWKRRNTYKYGLETQWFLNIAYFMGKQNVVWFDVLRQLKEPDAPSWRVRMVINILQAGVRTLIAKLYKPRTEWDVVPATADFEDAQVSELDKQVLQFRYQQQDMDEKLLDFIEWLILTGNGFFKVCWDPEAGDQLKINTDELQDTNEDIDFQALLQDAPDNIGDTKVLVRSPFSIMVDPLAQDMASCTWLMDSQIEYVQNIKDTWGTKADKVTADTKFVGTAQHFQLHRRMNQLQNSNLGSVTGGDNNEETAIVHELWFRPQGKGKLKEGRHIVICQNEVLKNEPFPYSHGRIPYVHCKEIPVKGSFWGSSTTEQLINVQTEYNKTKSQLIESRNLMSKPKWLLARGAGINSSAITSEPGEGIEYNAPYEPKMITPPGMPAYVKDMIADFRQDMEDISGQHEVSRAEAPGEVRSGRGIIALIQQDETRMGPTLGAIDRAMATVGKLILMTDTEFVKEERIAKYLGQDDKLFINQWSGKALIGPNYGRPGVDYFDVRVSTITGMPNNRAAQLELIDKLTERGYLNPQEDREKIFALLNIGKVTKILDNGRASRSIAIKENYEMAQGQQIQPQAYQDHIVHLEVLHDYMNREDYQNLPDEVKEMFLAHEQQHKELHAASKVEPQLLEQMAVQKLMMAYGMAPPPQEQPQKGQENEGQERSEKGIPA